MRTAIVGIFVFVLANLLIAGAVLDQGGNSIAPSASVSFTLYGSLSGWGFTATTIRSPGPTLSVSNGDMVTLRLFAADGIPHTFFVDYDGDLSADAGEPKSPIFSSPSIAVTYTFTVNVPLAKTFTYWCDIHYGRMFGSFEVRSPNRPPALGTISFVPSSPVPGQDVTFQATASDPDGDVLQYTWAFGDGFTNSGQTAPGGGTIVATHAYSNPGDYTVTLNVNDGKGGVAAASVVVAVALQIEVRIEAPWTKLYAGQTMDLTVVASASGSPLAGAAVAATLAGAGTLTPASGTTDASGNFKTTVKGNTSGTTITVTASVSKSGYVTGTASYPINIVPATTMTMVASTKTVEMMSFETATFAIRLTDATGAGLLNAQITGSSLPAGTFAPAEQLGGGDYRLRWSAPKVTTQTLDSISIRVKEGGYLDATARFSLKVDPNMTGTSPLHTLFVLGVPASVAPGGTVTIRAYVYTIEGYVVAGSTVVPSLRFTIQGTLGPVSDELNGLYTFTFTAASTLTPGTIVSVKIDVSKAGYAAGTTTVRVLIVAP